MRSRIVVGAALLAGLFAVVPTAAHAQDPVDLAGAYVLDESGVLDGDTSGIEAALDTLYAEAGIQLFVVYVDSFDGADSSAEWADTTAEISGLGATDALLAIATDDRVYQVSVAEDFPLSDSDLADIEADRLVPELRDDDWEGGAIAFADGLRGEGNGSGSLPVWPFILLLVAAFVGVLVYLFTRRARRAAAGESKLASGEPTQKELDQRAGTVLVEIDDSLRTSEQELGFAVAQFGEEATREFAAALATAKTHVAEAFGIRQKLDDAFPETPAQKRELTLQLIGLAESADTALDAQADAFDALREVEKNAASILDSVDAAAGALDARVRATEATVAQLAGRFSPAAIATVVDNVARARTLLQLAAASSSTARAAIAPAGGSKNGQTVASPAVPVRAAQAGVAQAGQLLDAVDSLAAALDRAVRDLDEAVAETNRDLAEARAVPGAELESVIAATSAGLAAVLPGSEKNPLDAIERVERLDETLGQALAAVRDRQAQEASARSSLDRVLASARTQIATGEEFLTTRRGGVGTDARTRLSAARQALDEAQSLAATDPVGALSSAHRASSLAQQGTDLARGEVDYFERSNADRGYSGGLGGSMSTDSILGGILGGLLQGGGGWSGGGGGSWSGGGSSSRRSTSYGGSSRRSSGGSRRSSGGSRGGRRGGGGRF
ncbi:hypothetical protein HD599_000938 [Conyzicola lurida]|uniref:TPM domain-containing protein n=1 Tax=Conyzicola lurida TaxID=1172621 RepID=A0A841AM73_9MICO|nr:TPM domain-containing protein [Conyzicola lurida]MBB5842615.1 hypothetical protein [Conyzicola lurida]